MDMVSFKINGKELSATKGTTILEAAKAANIYIPTLCYLKDYTKGSACRMCLVEVKGMRNPATSCNTPVSDGMEIETDTEKILHLRRENLDLIASNHRMDCTFCSKFPYCELNELMRKHGMDDRTYRYSREKEYDFSAKHLVRDNSKCILCGRCIAACDKMGISAIGFTGRGKNMRVTPGAANLPLPQTACIGCGECIKVCPVGALRVADDTQPVLNELHHKEKDVVVAVSKEACYEMAENFHLNTDCDTAGKTVGILRKLGFSKVYCLDDFEQLAKSKEAEEYKAYADKNPGAPMVSSSYVPAEIYIRKHHPQSIDILSKNGNPAREFAAYCKNVLTLKFQSQNREIYPVIITTCTADKNMTYEGIDVKLTSAELTSMYRRSCVSDYTAVEVWNRQTPEQFDDAEIEVPGYVPLKAMTIPEIKALFEKK